MQGPAQTAATALRRLTILQVRKGAHAVTASSGQQLIIGIRGVQTYFEDDGHAIATASYHHRVTMCNEGCISCIPEALYIVIIKNARCKSCVHMPSMHEGLLILMCTDTTDMHAPCYAPCAW